MNKAEIIHKISENVSGNRKTDRIMWFSIWFFLSVASFGVALFPMFYLLIERRNKHFLRQEELKNLLLRLKYVEEIHLSREHVAKRNSIFWTLSIIFVIPVFIIAYILTKDLILHEKEQRKLFTFLPSKNNLPLEEINLKLYLVVTLVTLGAGIIYWYYKIFNHYNNHFKKQWIAEDRIVKLLEGELHERRS